jgi:hypothetical protein
VEPRTTVTITRTDPKDAGHRQILARIDDDRTVSLMTGDARTLDVSPGAHTLHVNNTLFWKRVRFEIAAGESRHFSVVNLASRLSFGFLAGLGMAPMYLEVSETGGK